MRSTLWIAVSVFLFGVAGVVDAGPRKARLKLVTREEPVFCLWGQSWVPVKAG